MTVFFILFPPDIDLYFTKNGSLSEASLTNISTTLSSKEVFLASLSLYLLINFHASDPSSQKHFNPYPGFISLRISSGWASSLCKDDVTFAHGAESRICRYVSLQRATSSSVLILLSELTILRIADSCVWS